MRVSRLIILAVFLFSLLLVAAVLPASAQECSPTQNYFTSSFTIENSHPNLYFQQVGDYFDMVCTAAWCDYGDDYVSISQAQYWPIYSGDNLYLMFRSYSSANGTTFRARLHFTDDTTAEGAWRSILFGGGYAQSYEWDLSSYAGKTVDRLYIDYHGVYGYSEEYRFFPLESYFYGCPIGDCALVSDANFITDDTWLLSGSATITNGALTLADTDIAAQNITLEAGQSYNAVISTTVISGAASLNVVLGTDSQAIDISAPAWYTATFTTPSNLAGPIIYGLENQGAGTLEIDYTCVSLASGSSGESGCIAPDNGDFDDTSAWNWYRGAELFLPAKSANLPVADAGMIGSTSTYSMPTLASGQHLLIGFTSRGLGNGGAVSGQLTNGTSTAVFNFYTYGTEYSYEANLDSLAEETAIQLSFVNPAAELEGVTSTADILLDNICIFTANRGANLPAPVDPDGIIPIEAGLTGISSCADLDGIWAGFGVNMAQYRADYAAGASLWDATGWVPWLISALFVNLASWSCFFFASFLNIVDLLTYFINSVMNIGNWAVRMWPAFVAWLSLWNDWLAGSLANIANAIGNALADWSNWIGNALWATSETIALTLAAWSEWIGNSLANLAESIGNGLAAWSEWIGGTLAAWSEWIGATLAAWSEWIGATLAAWSEWIGNSLANFWQWLSDYLFSLNGVRDIVNWLIWAWNGFLDLLGAVISPILDLIFLAWNSLIPFLQSVWASTIGVIWAVTDLLTAMIAALWDLVSTIFWWLWANVEALSSIPLQFYYGFNSGVNSDGFSYMIECSGAGFWCAFLAGVQIVNQTVGQTVLYPIVIVGIVLATLSIVWNNLWKMVSIDIR